MLKIGIVGPPFTEITKRPLDSLVGIRVRTWGLFSLLERYGFETYLYVDAEAAVDNDIQEKYGSRVIRSEQEFLRQSKNGEFTSVLFCATKLEFLLSCHLWLNEIRNASIMGAFCYDNNAELNKAIIRQMIGTAFTTPLQKKKWDARGTGVPSFLITTGQTGQFSPTTETTGDAVFVGELRSIGALHLLRDIAERSPQRKYYVVAQRLIEQSNYNHVYVDFSAMSTDKREGAFRGFIESFGLSCPENLIYLYIPHGEEQELLNKVTVGLDFSWTSAQSIDNSKVSRYLTYGCMPVVQMPAPSYRFLRLFGVGEVLDYDAPPSAWVAAIDKAATTPLEVKNRVRQEASNFFSWERVAFEIASFLLLETQDHEATHSSIGQSKASSKLHYSFKKAKHSLLYALPMSPLRKTCGNISPASRAFKGKQVKDLGGFVMLLDPDEYIDQRLLKDGIFEPNTVCWLRENLPTGAAIVLDVGASNGYMSLICRQIVGKEGQILAIEPTQYGFERLCQNTTLNGYSNIRAYKVAFSDQLRRNVDITFDAAEYQKGTDHSMRSSWEMTNRGVDAIHEGAKDSCDFIPMDQFVKEHALTQIDLIKIDVDGNESAVLAGALETIQKYCATLIIEIEWTRNCERNGTFSKQLDRSLEQIFSFGYQAVSEDGQFFSTKQELVEYIRARAGHPTSPNFLFKVASR